MKIGFLGFGKIAAHHANAFQSMGCRIEAIQSRRIPGDVFGNKNLDAIIIALLPECLPEFMDRILADPRPCLIEKCPPCEGPANKIVAYNRRFFQNVGILRNRVAQGGLVDVSADLPPSGAQMHGFDLMMHLFGVIRATTVKASLNTSIRAIFDDESVWTLKPFETLTVHKGGSVEGAEKDNLRKYTFSEINRWSEDTTYKPGFLDQAKAFIHGVKTGDYGLACTLEENKRRYEVLRSLSGTPQGAGTSAFSWRRV